MQVQTLWSIENLRHVDTEHVRMQRTRPAMREGRAPAEACTKSISLAYLALITLSSNVRVCIACIASKFLFSQPSFRPACPHHHPPFSHSVAFSCTTVSQSDFPNFLIDCQPLHTQNPCSFKGGLQCVRVGWLSRCVFGETGEGGEKGRGGGDLVGGLGLVSLGKLDVAAPRVQGGDGVGRRGHRHRHHLPVLLGLLRHVCDQLQWPTHIVR